MRNNLYPLLHSSNRQNHSTETVLLKVRNDIIMEMSSRNVVLLVLLDLSATFDTVDNTILLSRLQSTLGITGKPLDWFTSYLSNRSKRASVFQVYYPTIFSYTVAFLRGLFLHILYGSKLFDITESHLPDAHYFVCKTLFKHAGLDNYLQLFSTRSVAKSAIVFLKEEIEAATFEYCGKLFHNFAPLYPRVRFKYSVFRLGRVISV